MAQTKKARAAFFFCCCSFSAPLLALFQGRRKRRARVVHMQKSFSFARQSFQHSPYEYKALIMIFINATDKASVTDSNKGVVEKVPTQGRLKVAYGCKALLCI